MNRLGIELSRLGEPQLSQIEYLAGLTDLRTALSGALEHLPETSRDALRLRIVEERPYPEVARRLRISEQAARARVSRGLRKLAAALGRNPHRRREDREQRPPAPPAAAVRR